MLQETLNMYTKVGGMEVSEMQKERQDKKKKAVTSQTTHSAQLSFCN